MRAFVVILFLAVQCAAATYTVNRLRNSTPKNFHSISALLRAVHLEPGDEVLVSANTVYHEVVDFSEVQGTLESPVVVKGKGGRAVIDGTGVDSASKGYLVYFGPTSANIVFEQMEVRNVTIGADLNDRGVYVRGTNITLRNCFIHHNGNGVFSSSPARNTIIETSEI